MNKAPRFAPEVVEDKLLPGEWRVEQIDPLGTGEGDVEIAQFVGPRSELRAREYHQWLLRRRHLRKNGTALRLLSPPMTTAPEDA